MKRAYYYLFYKLYKFFEAAPSRWWSDWKAGVAIVVLEMFTIVSFFNYSVFFINRDYLQGLMTSNLPYLFIFLLVVPFNVYLFVIKDDWKGYVGAFDKLPKRRKVRDNWIVFLGLILILANFIFSFHCYFQK